MISFFNKITAFFVSLAVAFGGIFCLFKPAILSPVSQDELKNMGSLFEEKELDDTIYVVTVSGVNYDMHITLECLQGLVNRDKIRLYMPKTWIDQNYINQIEASGVKIIRKTLSFEEVIQQFWDAIADSGFVLYRNSDYAEGQNVALSYASAKGWLAVAEDLKERAEACGLKMIKDISNDNVDYDYMLNFFNEYKDCFSKNGIVHIKSGAAGLRDFAVQQRMFVCYTGIDNEAQKFLKKVLNGIGENGIVLGWCEQEKHFVEFISRLGYSIVAADHSYNLSVLNSFHSDYTCEKEVKSITPDPDKHYISLIFSDGDNVQWISNGYSEFRRGQNIQRDYPITWGIPMIAQDLCSAVGKETTSAVKNEQDCFMAGPSGVGYCLPSAFEEKSMGKFSTDTAAAMLKSGLRTMCILDDKPIVFGERLFTRKFDYFSRFDNIDGGIIFLDPKMYSAGEGRIWFSNDKPFLSLKTTLYTDDGYDDVTKEWMQEQADIINSYVADNHSIKGYSAICVHAWSVTPENLDYLVSLLDEHIEIVNIDELLKMISENIPHKYAKP